jgi:hypothetical protein
MRIELLLYDYDNGGSDDDDDDNDMKWTIISNESGRK